MPAISREEYLRRIVDCAEEAGLKAEFDFSQCYIRKMNGEEVAWFDLGDRRNFRVSGNLFNAIKGGFEDHNITALKEFTDMAGRHTRGTLYAIRSGNGELWAAKELPDSSGVENAAHERFNAFYTIRGARRIILRYDIQNPRIVPLFDRRYSGVGAYADDLSKDQNVVDESDDKGRITPGGVYDPITNSRWRNG